MKRRNGKRKRFDRVLIVTEGSKTEPNYFEEIRIVNRLASAEIMVLPADGTQPLKVVESAELRFKTSKEFERVYAVFDRDAHPKDSYDNALTKAKALDGKLKNADKRKVPFRAVASVPCFEYWLLLHFTDLQGFRERDVILRDLKVQLPGYEKGRKDCYARTADKLDVATARAVSLRRRYTAETGTDPYTNVDELVGLLVAMKSE
jgi:hypothetical protein